METEQPKEGIQRMERQGGDGRSWAVPKEWLFIIEKQDDGNFKGWMQRSGKVIEVRDVDPQTVLTRLITHP